MNIIDIGRQTVRNKGVLVSNRLFLKDIILFTFHLAIGLFTFHLTIGFFTFNF